MRNAYTRARDAGHTTHHISQVINALIRNGGRSGYVLQRLHQLANEEPPPANPPTQHMAIPLPECDTCATPYRRTTTPPETCTVCGNPLTLTQYNPNTSTYTPARPRVTPKEHAAIYARGIAKARAALAEAETARKTKNPDPEPGGPT